jgi:hypothetical protein
VTGTYAARDAGSGRILGIERRSLTPAVVVALLFAAAVWGFPAWNDAVGYRDPIQQGDVVQLGPSVAFLPAPGWNLVEGYRRGDPDKDGSYPKKATLTYDGVQFSVVIDTFTGTPPELLAQIKKTSDGYRTGAGLKVTGDVRTIVNGEGDRGAAADFDGTHVKGLVGAFVFGAVGAEIVMLGPDQLVDSTVAQVNRMIQSVRPIRAGA